MLELLSVKNSDPSTPSSSTSTLFEIKFNIVEYPKISSLI